MGSNKKHKDKDRDRESKKKRKHRSRSRSRSPEKKKRRHKDRSSPPERDREADYPDPRDEFDARNYDGRTQRDPVPSREQRESPPPPGPRADSQSIQSKGDGSSLSIEETNRLRAKLGLKPLDVPDSNAADDEETKIKKQGGVHAPAVNMGQQKKSEKLKEKLSTKKDKRALQSKLSKVKGLGESDSEDEGAAAWVLKSRKQQQEKEMAEKRAKMLEEMDEDFGIGNLVEEEFNKSSKKSSYTSQNLKGLTVEHSIDKFVEGRNIILTLKDKGVLDEDEGDTLVNVNIEDDERAEKNVENKKMKPDYKPYDEPQYDEYGIMKPSNLLSKYDEEIDGAKKESFSLGSRGTYDAAHEKRMAEIRQQLRAQGQTLQVAAPVLASEYMTNEEMEAATFKKVKKKVRKIRKKDKVLKADDLRPLPEESTAEDYGSRSRGRGRVIETEDGELPSDEADESKVKAEPEAAFSTDTSSAVKKEPLASLKMEVDEDEDMDGPDEDLTGVALEEEQVQEELHGMLAKARKLKLKKERNTAPEAVAQMATDDKGQALQNQVGANIILNSTSEFCRNLGEIPTYGLAGNREEDRDEILDMELELMEQRQKNAEQEEQQGGWNEVDIDDNPVDIRAEDASVLEEEPIASVGVGAALLLAQKKGYLESEDPTKRPSMSKKALELQAQNYTIQDKRYDDLDEKNRKRERYQGGMITDFKEKESYKPDVKLDYVDDSGRQLSQKEAFRQLSHRFHGKGSGKKKTEKRGKKVEEELLMKRMSSTDTPLNTLSLLQDKQRSEQSPFIVLSGGSRGFTSNTIVKPS